MPFGFFARYTSEMSSLAISRLQKSSRNGAYIEYYLLRCTAILFVVDFVAIYFYTNKLPILVYIHLKSVSQSVVIFTIAIQGRLLTSSLSLCFYSLRSPSFLNPSLSLSLTTPIPTPIPNPIPTPLPLQDSVCGLHVQHGTGTALLLPREMHTHCGVPGRGHRLRRRRGRIPLPTRYRHCCGYSRSAAGEWVLFCTVSPSTNFAFYIICYV